MYRCRTLFTFLTVLGLTFSLWAAEDEGARNPNDPLDQGGEACAQAVPITSVAFCDSGTTAGFSNDYPVPCQTGSNAPDVVYSITPPVTSVLSFSLCGSAYNTALTIWRGCPSAGGVLVCCSDNVCGDDACCSGVTLLANVQYFVVVDGGLQPNSGNYFFSVVQGQVCSETPCQNTCPYPSLDIEPNNNCLSAQTTLTCGDTVCGLMEPNANDFYVFTVPGPGSQYVSIDVFGDDTPGWFPFGGGLNPRVEVQTCSTTFGNDSNSGVGEDARLDSLCLAPGTYLLRVAAEPQTNSGPYIIAIHCEPCPPDTCPFPSRDFEPLNDNCTANIPNITCGDTLCGEISTSADRDWYRLNFTQFPCADIRIAVYGDDTPGHFPFGQGLNPKVSIYAADCATLIAQDSDGGLGLDALLDSLCLPAGSYHVLVESEGAIGPYELWVWCTGCDCPSCPYPDLDNEPNNICSGGGGVLACGDTVCGFQEMGSNDYYYFQVQGPGCKNVIIDVFGDDTPGYYPFGQGLNPVVQLIASDCVTPLASDNSSGIGEDARIDSLCLPPGIYRLRVSSQPQATNFGPYIIATSCTPCACPGECPYPNRDQEPLNNSCGTNNPILSCNDAVCGEISNVTGADEDWYLLQLTACNQLFIDVFGDDTPGFYPFGFGLNPALELWSADCSTPLYQDFNSGQGEDAQLNTPCLEPGIYMLRVYGELGTQGPYIMFIGCESCQCGPPCEVICPQGALLENEPCPSFVDTTNGGCVTDPHHFLPLQCDQFYCGTGFASPNYIDTDWYRIALTTPTNVRLCVNSEFDGYLNLYAPGPGPDGCESLDLVECLNITGCEGFQCLSVCLPRGIYVAEYRAAGVQLVNCWDYVIGMGCSSCEPTVCEAPDSVVISYPDTLSAVDPIADVTLRWPPVAGATEYRVHRTSNNNTPFFPTPATYVATTFDTAYVHEGVIVNNGTSEIWIYYVLAYCGYNHEPCDVAPAAVAPAQVLPMRRAE